MTAPPSPPLAGDRLCAHAMLDVARRALRMHGAAQLPVSMPVCRRPQLTTLWQRRPQPCAPALCVWEGGGRGVVGGAELCAHEAGRSNIIVRAGHSAALEINRVQPSWCWRRPHRVARQCASVPRTRPAPGAARAVLRTITHWASRGHKRRRRPAPPHCIMTSDGMRGLHRGNLRPVVVRN